MGQYRIYIRQILSDYADIAGSGDAVERQVLFDSEHDRYQLFIIGWKGYKRFYGSLIHIDIINGKIWVQCDWTEYRVVEKLVDLGVPKSDIVLAFHAPYKRKFTEFGTGDENVEAA